MLRKLVPKCIFKSPQKDAVLRPGWTL